MGETKTPEYTAPVKSLVEFDEKYMQLEKEYAKEWTQLQMKFEALQKPWLEKRRDFVNENRDIPDFWLTVLQGHPIFNEEIMTWDREILLCLKDIRTEKLEDPSGMDHCGFKIIFEFGENEFMTNTELVRVYETGLESEFLMEVAVKNIFMEKEIEWKIGKDPTQEISKVKGKKKKSPRNSFFRTYFRTINLQDPETLKDLMDRTLKEMGYDIDDAEDDEEMEQAYEDALEKVNDDAYEYGLALRDAIIPYAVRWYTGEAMPKEPEEAVQEESDADADEDADEDESEAEENEGETDDDDKEAASDEKKPATFSKSKQDVKAEECKQQ